MAVRVAKLFRTHMAGQKDERRMQYAVSKDCVTWAANENAEFLACVLIAEEHCSPQLSARYGESKVLDAAGLLTGTSQPPGLRHCQDCQQDCWLFRLGHEEPHPGSVSGKR